MKQLTIGNPYLNSNKLCSEIQLSDKDETVVLWYEVSSEYVPYLCTEKSDAFLVNLLLYAMENDYNIVCEGCISEKLYYQLTEYLIPTISQNIEVYKPIIIKAPLSSEILLSQNCVGGSISGGVDSFFTAIKHRERLESNFNITHYTFFNAGASGMYGGEKARKIFHERIDWIKQVAIEQGKPLVVVDTNFNEFLHQVHVETHTFRSLAIPLALQKLFSVYYYSSGVPFNEFEISKSDTASYDLLIMSCLNTENITFYSHGGNTTRIEKLKYISSYPVTYKYLNVCVWDATNCCRCPKCRKTMMELHLIGKLDNYSKVFDLNIFNSDKTKIIYEAIVRKNQHDWNDIYFQLKKMNMITPITEIKAKIYFPLRNIAINNRILVKLYKKLFRR